MSSTTIINPLKKIKDALQSMLSETVNVQLNTDTLEQKLTALTGVTDELNFQIEKIKKTKGYVEKTIYDANLQPTEVLMYNPNIPPLGSPPPSYQWYRMQFVYDVNKCLIGAQLLEVNDTSAPTWLPSFPP